MFNDVWQFALRWRTESEVISGAGESTCGNTRCALHSPRNVEERFPGLKTLELPFSYEEKGDRKIALVKVVLCDKCCRKLVWKRKKEKESTQQDERAKEEKAHGGEDGVTNSQRTAQSPEGTEVKAEEVSLFV